MSAGPLADSNGQVPFPLVPLCEILRQFREYIDAPESKTYPKLSVKLYGKGVTLDTPADGALLRMKRHQIARAGQVILSEIWGKKGAVGIVPPEGDGALCTSHFFLFDVIEDRLEPRYLQLIFTANYLQEQLDAEARGTTGYAAVRPKQFLAATIPLPALAEQRRIVARIEEVAGKIEEARGLRRAAVGELDALARAIVFEESGGLSESTPMREIVRPRIHDVMVERNETYHFAGVYSFGRGVFRGQRRLGADFSYSRLGRLRAGDFVYPKLMAWEGALGVVPPDCDGLVVSPEFPIFEVDERRVLPETLDVYFRTPEVWSRIAGSSTGTNVRRRRLQPTEFLAYEMPLPPMATQIRLRNVMRRTEPIRRLQAGTEAEMEALKPAVLERAFRGEL